MKKLITPIFIAACFMWVSEIASAQIEGISEGDSIRISAPSVQDGLITGMVDSVSSDTVRVASITNGAMMTKIPLSAIEQLEVRKVVRKTGRGALIGGGVAALTLGIISAASYEPCGSDEWCLFDWSRGKLFLMGAGIGLLPGALIGAAIGSRFKKVKWKRIDVQFSNQTVEFINLSTTAPGLTIRWTL